MKRSSPVSIKSSSFAGYMSQFETEALELLRRMLDELKAIRSMVEPEPKEWNRGRER